MQTDQKNIRKREWLIWVLLLILAVPFSISASWIYIGASNGMSAVRMISPVSYEKSEAAAEYMENELTKMLLAVEAGEVSQIDPDDKEDAAVGADNLDAEGEAWLIDSEETNVLFWMKNPETGAVYTNVESWGYLALAEVRYSYLNSDNGYIEDGICYLSIPNLETGNYQSGSGFSDRVVNELLVWLQESVPDTGYTVFCALDTSYPVVGSVATTRHKLYAVYQSRAGVWTVLFPFELIALGLVVYFAVKYAWESLPGAEHAGRKRRKRKTAHIRAGKGAAQADSRAKAPGREANAAGAGRNAVPLPAQESRLHRTGQEGTQPVEEETFPQRFFRSMADRAGRYFDKTSADAPGIPEKIPLEVWLLSDVILCLLFVFAISRSSVHSVISQGRLTLNFTAGMFSLALLAAKVPAVYGRRLRAHVSGEILVRTFRKWMAGLVLLLAECRQSGRRIARTFVWVVVLNLAWACFIVWLFWILYGVSWFLRIFWTCAAVFVLVLIDLYWIRKFALQAHGEILLRKALEAMAEGETDVQIGEEELTPVNRETAAVIGRLQLGLQEAVESRLKSERLKTDLITNVSHDLRTPLTSIINYVDILKHCDIEDETVLGYLDILDQKSARLKQLTDDLIEASKISSGNIVLDMQPINLKELIRQTNGEFEEKFEARDLVLVCNLPKEELRILADGRRMYRVLENLYSNAAKYSMPGTRIYVDAAVAGDNVEVTIKNISESQLNISAEELQERFVRGDNSRTSEGSGLGLEIARNLAVMQGGTFDISIDGDLFKVKLLFERLESQEEPIPKEEVRWEEPLPEEAVPWGGETLPGAPEGDVLLEGENQLALEGDMLLEDEEFSEAARLPGENALQLAGRAAPVAQNVVLPEEEELPETDMLLESPEKEA